MRQAFHLAMLLLVVSVPPALAEDWTALSREAREAEGFGQAAPSRYAQGERVDLHPDVGLPATFVVRGPDGPLVEDDVEATYTGTPVILWRIPAEATPGAYTIEVNGSVFSFEVLTAPRIWTERATPEAGSFARFSIVGFDTVSMEVVQNGSVLRAAAQPTPSTDPPAIAWIWAIEPRVAQAQVYVFPNGPIEIWANGTRDGVPSALRLDLPSAPGPERWLTNAIYTYKPTELSPGQPILLVGQMPDGGSAEVYANGSLLRTVGLPRGGFAVVDLGSAPAGDLQVVMGSEILRSRIVVPTRAETETYPDPGIGALGTLIACVAGALVALRARSRS